MIGSWRPLVVAAVVCATTSGGVAAAQTVIVRHAPVGAIVDVEISGGAAGSATADSQGDARVALNSLDPTAELAAHVLVDTCGTARRIVLVGRSQIVPPPGVGCDRKEIAGFFVVRRITSMVIDIGPAVPILLISQGPAPAAWLTPDSEAARIIGPSPAGLAVFGGVSFVSFRDYFNVLCGNATPCKGQDFTPTYSVGALYWVNRALGAEVSYVRSATQTASGSGEGFHFDSKLDAEILTVAANVGVPVGMLRPYGKLGLNRHTSILTTSQTLDDFTADVDDVPVTVKGGTQESWVRMGGWGWVAGVGIEVWPKPRLAWYAEAVFGGLKGADLDGGDGEIDERIFSLMIGGRLYIGRFGR